MVTHTSKPITQETKEEDHELSTSLAIVRLLQKETKHKITEMQ